MGGRNGGVYEDENDPGLVSMISEWESQDQMHERPRNTATSSIRRPGRSACSGPLTSGIARETPDRSH
jgi:quinol monooxygenase YgiN